MYLTVNRKFEFCASRRLALPGQSEDESVAYYGDDALGRFGQGRNYAAFFVFTGEVDPTTGMLVNLAEIKRRLSDVIDTHFDHKNLNEDTSLFQQIQPTAENVSVRLLEEAKERFEQSPAIPVACHVRETPELAATAYSDGRIEVHYHFDFSAARQTYSPNLSAADNRALFGTAASEAGHGHHYRLRATLGGEFDEDPGCVVAPAGVRTQIGGLRKLFDHRHLNKEVAEVAGMPMTTECLARFMFNRLAESLPIRRLLLRETDWFFVEYRDDGVFSLSVNDSFSAMHRLHSKQLSDRQNADMYGKCNNAKGHGHYYDTECTISRELDEQSGTLYPLNDIRGAVRETLEEFDNKYLDEEVAAFAEPPTSGENIVRTLWSRFTGRLGPDVYRVRLSETPKNRFAIRRDVNANER